MFNLQKIWNKYGFEIMFVIGVIIILFLIIFKKDEKTGIISFSKFFNKKGKKGKKDNKFTVENSEDIQSENLPGKDSKGEIECKRVMESIFKKPFTKIRPDWLFNQVTGKNLELDVYNEELKIAVEYSGRQHYNFVPYFHKTKEHFTMQKYRDEMKKQKCKERGIFLIEVPYNVEIKDIEKFLVNELKNNGKI